MARRGRFGRRPNGGGSNLAALIASLIREQRAAQDRAIFDAYNNGGLFEGKPVTDGRLLEYIQTRRDQFSKDDPLWDQWNNSYIQQKFTIGEQKIALAYKQGKASASQVAAFYRSQLDSIPKDSAFYREVAGRAAEWAKAARQGSGGGGGGGGSRNSIKSNYEQAQNGLQDSLAASILMEQAIRRAIAAEGIVIRPGDSVFSVGADVITRLFNTGKVVTTDGRVLSTSDYEATATNTDTAYATAISAYKAAGYNYVTLLNQRYDFANETLTKIDTLPYQVRAESIYSTLNQELEAAQGSPDLLSKAYAKARDALMTLAGEAKKAGADTEIIAGMTNDAVAFAGGKPAGPGLMDQIMSQNAITGQSRWVFLEPDQGVATAAAQAAADSATVIEKQKIIASGKGYLAQDPETGVLTVKDSTLEPKGTQPVSMQPTLININGVPTQVWLSGQPVVGNAVVDNQGNISPAPDPRTVDGIQGNMLSLGYQFTYQVGGETVTAWAVKTPLDANNPNGPSTLTFYTKNPFLGNMTQVGGTWVVSNTIEGIGVAQDIPDFSTFISSSVKGTGSPTLIVDAEAQSFIQTNPERAAALLQEGKIDSEVLVGTIKSADPNAPAFTTVEDALAYAQAAKDSKWRTAQSERTERFDVQTQAQGVATSIFTNLIQQTVGSVPTGNPFQPRVNWTPAQTQAALIQQRAGERASLTAPSSVPPTPPPPPEPPPPTLPSTPLSLPSYAYPAPTKTATIKSPSTTTVSTGRYAGKIVPL